MAETTHAHVTASIVDPRSAAKNELIIVAIGCAHPEPAAATMPNTNIHENFAIVISSSGRGQLLHVSENEARCTELQNRQSAEAINSGAFCV
eukprot:1853603-Pleurochrysis_carterae.AAC.3